MDFVKVTLVPPIRITELIDNNNSSNNNNNDYNIVKNNIEIALRHVVENYVLHNDNDDDDDVYNPYLMSLTKTLDCLCQPEDGIGPLINQLSNYFKSKIRNDNNKKNNNNNNSDNDDDNNIYQIIMKNALIGTQLVRNTAASLGLLKG